MFSSVGARGHPARGQLGQARLSDTKLVKGNSRAKSSMTALALASPPWGRGVGRCGGCCFLIGNVPSLSEVLDYLWLRSYGSF